MLNAAPASLSLDIAPPATMPLVEVRGLRKYFPIEGRFGNTRKHVRAVEDVSFTIGPGETLGLVGESGCGKTTVGRLVLGLLEPSAGSVVFRGQALSTLKKSERRRLRRRMQPIFQDPYSSLNPRRMVGVTIGEPLAVHRLFRGAAIERRVGELLERVGLPKSYSRRYPHELSGGQRQRVCIARALALEPEFIVCDEATSALDISIQAQILNLLAALRTEYGLSYLFISHNLNVVRHIADRIAVMYLGKFVEVASARELFESPRHPYTRALLSANPLPDPDSPYQPVALRGEPPSSLTPPSGCPFHPRCPAVFAPCHAVVPTLRSVAPSFAEGNQQSYDPAKTAPEVSCHLYSDAEKPA